MAALARLLERAQAHEASEPDTLFSPRANTSGLIDAAPEELAYRLAETIGGGSKIRREEPRRKRHCKAGRRLSGAKTAWRQAAAGFIGFRFHDLQTSGHHRACGNRCFRRHIDGPRRPHVPPDAGTLRTSAWRRNARHWTSRKWPDGSEAYGSRTGFGMCSIERHVTIHVTNGHPSR